MTPEYEKLWDMYQTKDKKRDDLVISRIEGSINNDISVKYGVSSFPMIILLHPNDLYVKSIFQGQRTANEMHKWIESNTPRLQAEPNPKKQEPNPKKQEPNPKKQEPNPNKQAKPSPQVEKTNTTETELGKYDKNEIIKKANKTEVTDELEFLKREILDIKKGFEKFQEEFSNFTLSYNQSRNESTPKIKIKPVHTESALVAYLEHLSVFTIIFISGLIMVAIATCLTVVRVLKRKKIFQPINHEKV